VEFVTLDPNIILAYGRLASRIGAVNIFDGTGRVGSGRAGKARCQRRIRPLRLAQGPLRPLLANRSLSLPELLSGPDAAGAKRAMEAMLKMTKLDIATLDAAYDGS
jgi:hypothetical protein